MINNHKAKIFISCGQTKGTDEVDIANSISDTLKKMGFETYIAVENQSLKGLKEVLFKELASSEYFLFIDYKREKIKSKLRSKKNKRGSLFSHQELAIASFQNIEFLGFQEDGVELNGILKFLQGNCTTFYNRKNLPKIILEKVKSVGWKSNWKNQLLIERESGQFTDALRLPEKLMARFFHININNQNPYNHAKNCYAFVEKIQSLSSNNPIRPNSIEMKWAGYTKPNATILSNSLRKLDGFLVFHDAPHTAHFNLFSDSTEYNIKIANEGDYDITYLVVSDNLPTTTKTLRLHLSKNIDDVTFEEIE